MVHPSGLRFPFFYTGIFSSILINRKQTESFPVSREVCQGCPLSPLLYVNVAETIAAAIRLAPGFDGYYLPNSKQAKICQNANDTSIIVASPGVLEAVFSLFQCYELASGAKRTTTKSRGLLFGSWKHWGSPPVELKW